MINMSYCRFQNTRQALRECHEAMSDAPSPKLFAAQLSSEERQALRHMVYLMSDMLEFCEEFED